MTDNNLRERERLEAVIEFSLKLIGLKHPEVRAHCERVGSMAEKTAAALGLDSYAARTGGLLHDLGKVVLPFALFDGKDIDDEGYRLVQEHVALGYRALSDKHLFTALICGLHHSMNERGYGLSWRDLPPEIGNHTARKILEIATIVAICDFADAYSNRKTTLKDPGGGGSLPELLASRFPDSRLAIATVLELVQPPTPE